MREWHTQMLVQKSMRWRPLRPMVLASSCGSSASSWPSPALVSPEKPTPTAAGCAPQTRARLTPMPKPSTGATGVQASQEGHGWSRRRRTSAASPAAPTSPLTLTLPAVARAWPLRSASSCASSARRCELPFRRPFLEPPLLVHLFHGVSCLKESSTCRARPPGAFAAQQRPQQLRSLAV